MKLSKAIELNKETDDSLRNHKFIDHADAVKLGIEALKHTKNLRNTAYTTKLYLLPGEDPE